MAEKLLGCSVEVWKEIMTIKINENYSSVDKLLKELLELRRNEKK